LKKGGVTINFNDKIVLVTGGSSGIGRATALAFAREGATVAIADIHVEGGNKTVDMIKEKGQDAIFFKTDVVEFGNAFGITYNYNPGISFQIF
jgi:NAD(P)-dependent dehydrogenase (short-subunit alcohol dehydrogenase family)